MSKLSNKAEKRQIGEKYLNLTIVEKYTSNKNLTRYKCVCDCGNSTDVASSQINRTVSCGCARRWPKSKYYGKPGEVSYNAKYKGYKETSKKRNLEFDLSKDEFKEITSKNCHYCGAVPKEYSCYRKSNTVRLKHTLENSTIYINGIDRIDNNIGYRRDNIVPCCYMCNSFKSSFILEDFLNHINKIKTFQENLHVN